MTIVAAGPTSAVIGTAFTAAEIAEAPFLSTVMRLFNLCAVAVVELLTEFAVAKAAINWLLRFVTEPDEVDNAFVFAATKACNAAIWLLIFARTIGSSKGEKKLWVSNRDANKSTDIITFTSCQ